jgi:cytochrome c-type biogenesis protein CcmH
VRRGVWFTLAVAVLFACAGPTFAQTPTPNEINSVARELWCPLCNGVRLDNCELQACIQMREVIADKLMAGESAESIKAYFVTQYGDVVLGQPSREGFNLVAWLFPILAAIVGLGWVAYLVTTWRKRQTPLTATTALGSQADTIDQPGEESDDYMKRVERELHDTE